MDPQHLYIILYVSIQQTTKHFCHASDMARTMQRAFLGLLCSVDLRILTVKKKKQLNFYSWILMFNVHTFSYVKNMFIPPIIQEFKFA